MVNISTKYFHVLPKKDVEKIIEKGKSRLGFSFTCHVVRNYELEEAMLVNVSGNVSVVFMCKHQKISPELFLEIIKKQKCRINRDDLWYFYNEHQNRLKKERSKPKW